MDFDTEWNEGVEKQGVEDTDGAGWQGMVAEHTQLGEADVKLEDELEAWAPEAFTQMW